MNYLPSPLSSQSSDSCRSSAPSSVQAVTESTTKQSCNPDLGSANADKANQTIDSIHATVPASAVSEKAEDTYVRTLHANQVECSASESHPKPTSGSTENGLEMASAQSAALDMQSVMVTNPSLCGFHHGPIPDPNPDWKPPEPSDIDEPDAMKSRMASVSWLVQHKPPHPRVKLAQTNTLVCDVVVHQYRDERTMCGKVAANNSSLRTHIRYAHPGCLDPVTPKRNETASERAAALLAIRMWVFTRGWRNALYAHEPGKPVKSLCSHYAEQFEARARREETYRLKHGEKWHRDEEQPHRKGHQFAKTYIYEPTTDTKPAISYDAEALLCFEKPVSTDGAAADEVADADENENDCVCVGETSREDGRLEANAGEDLEPKKDVLDEEIKKALRYDSMGPSTADSDEAFSEAWLTTPYSSRLI